MLCASLWAQRAQPVWTRSARSDEDDAIAAREELEDLLEELLNLPFHEYSGELEEFLGWVVQAEGVERVTSFLELLALAAEEGPVSPGARSTLSDKGPEEPPRASVKMFSLPVLVTGIYRGPVIELDSIEAVEQALFHDRQVTPGQDIRLYPLAISMSCSALGSYWYVHRLKNRFANRVRDLSASEELEWLKAEGFDLVPLDIGGEHKASLASGVYFVIGCAFINDQTIAAYAGILPSPFSFPRSQLQSVLETLGKERADIATVRAKDRQSAEISGALHLASESLRLHYADLLVSSDALSGPQASVDFACILNDALLEQSPGTTALVCTARPYFSAYQEARQFTRELRFATEVSAIRKGLRQEEEPLSFLSEASISESSVTLTLRTTASARTAGKVRWSILPFEDASLMHERLVRACLDNMISEPTFN